VHIFTGIKEFRFHDLRHTFASHLALKGVDLYTIQKLGRWKTLSMVMKYAHLSPKHQQTAINVLSGLFENKDL
jgi:integrase